LIETRRDAFGTASRIWLKRQPQLQCVGAA
jgi:hypothetical protein